MALYPDALLSQLLMAATYPQDVAQAAQWSRANPGLKGDEAVRAVENEPWAPAVKSLVAFPELLAAMGDQPQWTERLGQAFLASEASVLQTVQQLRRRADEAGNLQSSEQIAVERVGSDYVLEPAQPEVVHVPYYDPRTAYGSWWWPGYQPIYWDPWPGYGYYGHGFGWGYGVALHRGFFYGGFNWRHRHVHYSHHRPYYHRGGNYWGGWRHDRRDGHRDGRNDGRNDGRRYTQDRSPRPQQPRYDGRDRPLNLEGGRNPQRIDRADGNTRGYNPGVRTASPRYNMGGTATRPDGYRNRGERPVQAQRPIEAQRPIQAQRPVQVQRADNIQRAPRVRPMPQSVPPTAGFQRGNAPQVVRGERVGQSAPRAAQPPAAAAFSERRARRWWS